MENNCSAFSSDGQYWATCGQDGKLKIWETGNNHLKQEFIPNLHLSSPCSVLQWMTFTGQSTIITPGKKKRKKSMDDANQRSLIAMGSVNGKITIYDVATSSVDKSLENGHSKAVTALAWSSVCGLFSADNDRRIIQWDVKDCSIKSKWKSQQSKITCMTISPDNKLLITANNNIHCWDLERKNVVRTITGHINQIYFLKSVQFDDETCYLISGAKGDSYLSVWSLNSEAKTPIENLSITSDPVSLSVQLSDNSKLTILATNRSNQMNVFKYQPNGINVGKSPKKPKKPLKPDVSVVVMAQSNTKDNSKVPQIPIHCAHLTEDDKILAAYGSGVSIIFEKITIDYSEKVQILVRSDMKQTKERKEESVSKVKTVDTDGDVEYLTLGSVNSNATKRTKNSTGSQLPLKERLENLSLTTDTDTTSGKKPSKHLTHLLMQGLNSKDKNILTSVLYNRDEKIVKNTISSLPIGAIPPLLKELSAMLQNKPFASKIAVEWLQNIITMHAAHLLSLPDIGDVLSPILGFIDAKLLLLPELSRLRGRVALVTGQISHLNDKNNQNMTEDCLLVYQDSGSSDEDTDADALQNQSESDDNWEESSTEEMENGRSDDDDDDDDDNGGEDDSSDDDKNEKKNEDDDDDNISISS